ncbi:MAG TPA: hypothetical protein PKA61_01085 [Nitrospira sp.]|nr:hypothetical protein [Nitrospira sp.]
MNRYSSSLIDLPVSFRYKIIALTMVLAFWTVAVVSPAWSQESATPPPSEGGNASSAGIGVLSGLSTILYLPIKTAFAIGGGLVGGLAYVFSGGNEHAAKSIWTTSMYGTYVITPEHLRGDKPIRFLGVADTGDASTQTTAPAMDSAPAVEPVR